MSNQTAKTTTVSFTIAGQEGLSIFNNVTIPKNAVSYGAIPVVLIDDQYASNQGYAQDANNFYVWYTTLLSAHQVKIQFAASSSSQLPISPVVIVGVLVTEIVLIYTAIAVRRLRRKPSNE
jgi:adenine-specific DNA methylase